MTEEKPRKNKTKIYICTCVHGHQNCSCKGTGYIEGVTCAILA